MHILETVGYILGFIFGDGSPSSKANHFQLSATFQPLSTNVNLTTIFDHILLKQIKVGCPGQIQQLLLDDYYGSTMNKNSKSWLFGNGGQLDLGDRMRFFPGNSSTFTDLNRRFQWPKEQSEEDDSTLIFTTQILSIENETNSNKTDKTQQLQNLPDFTSPTEPDLINRLFVDILHLESGLPTGKATGLTKLTLTQTFGLMNQMEEEEWAAFKQLPIDGLLNLESYGNSSTKTFVQNLMGCVENKIITFWMEPRQFPQLGQLERKAIFTFGNLDPEHCFQANWWYTPQLNDTNDWTFQLDSIEVGPSNSSSNILQKSGMNFSQTAVLAKTSLLTQGPQDQVERIAELVGATLSVLYPNRFVMECSRKLDLNITFGVGDQSLTLTPKDYLVQDPLDENFCALIFTVKPDRIDQVDWVLGAPLLNNLCVCLDLAKKKIGFTTAI